MRPEPVEGPAGARFDGLSAHLAPPRPLRFAPDRRYHAKVSTDAGPGSKVGTGAIEALRDVLADGQLIAVGGFGLCGIPVDLIEAVRDSGVGT